MMLVGAIATTVAGCAPQTVTLDEKARLNAMLVRDYHLAADEAAVVRQSTIYPYHFESASARLNELGQRDVSILARRCGVAPGEAPAHISVRRGDTSDTLYRARLQTVRAMFAEAGVSVGTELADDLPGGDGMRSDRVLEVKDRVPMNRSDTTPGS